MNDPNLLDPDLRVLFDDVKARDAIDPAFDEVAARRMLERVERVVHGRSIAERSFVLRGGAILVCLVAMLAGSRFVSERKGGAPMSLGPSVAPTSLGLSTAPSPSAPAVVLPTLSVDDLPSSALPPPSYTPPASVSTPSAPLRRSELAEEYHLVEGARAKLAAKDYIGALRSIRAHEARFPRGQLNQECESLYIQLLVETGRIDEARERERRFRARFPKGLLLPSVTQAIANDPGTVP